MEMPFGLRRHILHHQAKPEKPELNGPGSPLANGLEVFRLATKHDTVKLHNCKTFKHCRLFTEAFCADLSARISQYTSLW